MVRLSGLCFDADGVEFYIPTHRCETAMDGAFGDGWRVRENGSRFARMSIYAMHRINGHPASCLGSVWAGYKAFDGNGRGKADISPTQR